MMTFDELWSQLATKRPGLDTPDFVVHITTANLKALLKQTYDAGQKSAPRQGDLGIFDHVFEL